MPYSAVAKNYMLDQLGANKALYASIHDDPPGDSGANEISGGSPAYARQAVTWQSASGGAMGNTGNLTFDIPAGTSVKYVGFWDAVSGGNFQGYDDVTQEDFAGQGTYKVTDAVLDLNA